MSLQVSGGSATIRADKLVVPLADPRGTTRLRFRVPGLGTYPRPPGAGIVEGQGDTE